MRFSVSQSAEQDLEEIFLYWAEQAGDSVAARITDDIVDRFRFLGEYPRSRRDASQIARGVRCFPAGRYLIDYRVERRITYIVHVFHGSRDQTAAFKGEKSLR